MNALFFHKSWSFLSNFGRCQRTSIIIFLLVDVYVVEHGHKDDSITIVWRICNAVKSGNNFHSNSIGSLSNHQGSLKDLFTIRKVATWPFHCLIASFWSINLSQAQYWIRVDTYSCLHWFYCWKNSQHRWILSNTSKYSMCLGSKCTAAFLDDTRNHLLIMQ